MNSSSIPTTSALISSSTTLCSGCASSIRKCGAWSSSPARTMCSAPAPISVCSASPAAGGGPCPRSGKRKVRRWRSDVFCWIEEGIRGNKAVEWRLIDEVVPNSKWKETVAVRAKEIAARSDRPGEAKGITLTPFERKIEADRVTYSHVDVEIDRARGLATVTVRGPSQTVPVSIEAAHALGAKFWPLTVARELEDAILHLRTNEPAIGVLLFRTNGDAKAVLAHDDFLAETHGDWLMREIRP